MRLAVAVTSVYYWRLQDRPWFEKISFSLLCCARSRALASLQAVHDYCPWPFLASLTFSEVSLKIAKFWMFCPGFQTNPSVSLAWNRMIPVQLHVVKFCKLGLRCSECIPLLPVSAKMLFENIPTSGQDRQTDRQPDAQTDRGLVQTWVEDCFSAPDHQGSLCTITNKRLPSLLSCDTQARIASIRIA